MIVVTSTGSRWFIDEEAKVYRRVPLEEGPREEPWLSLSIDTALEDLVPHTYESWDVLAPGAMFVSPDRTRVARYRSAVLVFRHGYGKNTVAPLPPAEYERARLLKGLTS